MSDAAQADVRTLRIEEPKLVAAALAESVTRLQKVAEAAKAGNYQEAASQIDALVVLVNHVRASVMTA